MDVVEFFKVIPSLTGATGFGGNVSASTWTSNVTEPALYKDPPLYSMFPAQALHSILTITFAKTLNKICAYKK